MEEIVVKVSERWFYFLLPAVDILNRDGWTLVFLSKTADSRFSSEQQGLFTRRRQEM